MSLFISVNNVAREGKNLWFGDENGIARKVKKAWYGDSNGVAKLIYDDFTELLTDIDDMYKYAEMKIGNSYKTMTSIQAKYAPYDEANDIGVRTGEAWNWEYAFANCSNLTTLPNPFYDTSELNTSEYMFYNCSSLVDASMVDFGQAVYMHRTFEGCTNLVNIPTIPNTAKYISYMFTNCSSLVNAPVIPNGVIDMDDTFYGCTSLTTPPTIPNTVETMGSCFAYCSNLQTPSNIPSGVEDLSWTFYKCGNLQEAPVIPNSVTVMFQTFGYCTSLTEAPELPENISDLGYLYYYCTNLTSVPPIPEGVTTLDHTFAGCESLETIPEIPSTLTNLHGAFEYCKNLKGPIVITADNITDATDCFHGCWNNYKELYVHANTTTYDAFYRAMGGTYNKDWDVELKCIEDVEVPSIETMANYAKENIPSYATMTTIPEEHGPANIVTKDTENWEYAFDGCSALTELPSPFYDMTNAKYVERMFYQCTNLVDASPVKFGNNVTSMYDTFAYCENLSVPPVLPSGLTNLSATFQSCYSLTTSPVIPEGVTEMNWTFDSSGLETAPELPQSLESLEGTFAWSCVTTPSNIPANVTNIANAYTDCADLQGDIYIYSDNVADATEFLAGCTNYHKNIYVHPNTTTYNTLYEAMGGATNEDWNATLVPMTE